MKISLSISNVKETLKNLKEAGIVIKKDFQGELIEHGKSLRDQAKEILESESQMRTNKKYWTGNLKDSIKMNIIERDDEVVGISVGPDMRVAPYAEWIEIGHFTGYGAKHGGQWWEGYHYLEQAYLRVAPEITNQIAKTLRVSLNRFERTHFKRTRHKTTGKFVKGFGNL